MTDTWTWATVTQASPLRIKVDGDTSALDATTDNLVGSLAVDDRVRVHLHSDGIIVTGIQGGGNRSNPNLLINSNFAVNQAGYVSGSNRGVGDYALDGWKVTATSGGSAHMTAVLTSQGQPVAINGWWQQIIERANVSASAYTLSQKSGMTSGNWRVYNVGATPPAFRPLPATFTLDGLADVVVEVASGTGSDTVGEVKFERGSVATPYETPRYDDNLRTCSRFYQRLTAQPSGAYSRLALGFAVNTGVAVIHVLRTDPMRVGSPTVMTSGALALYDGVTIHAISGISVGGGGPKLTELVCGASGLTQFRPYELLTNNDVNAFVALDARL